jgi:hypothetical protein
MSAFSLPDDILISIVGNWSETHFIGRLDIACCSLAIRTNFVKLLAHDSLSLEYSYPTRARTTNTFFNWINNRNIKLSSLHLDLPDNFGTKNELLYPINLVKVRELYFNSGAAYFIGSIQDINIEDVINGCINLIHLTITSPTSVNDDLFCKIIERLPKLVLLNIIGQDLRLTFTKMLQTLANNCKNLQDINFSFWMVENSDNDLSSVLFDCKAKLCNLLRFNTHIKQFTLNISDLQNVVFENHGSDIDGFIQIISNMCPMIEIVDLTLGGNLNVSSIGKLFLTNKQLRKLSITCSYNDSINNEIDKVIVFNHDSSKSIYCSEFNDLDNEFDNDDADLHLRCLFCADNFLTDVKLFTIHGLSDDLIHVISTKNCQTLVSLSINHCGTNWSISAIVRTLIVCPQLTALELRGCQHLSNNNFAELCSTPNTLSTLTIYRSRYLDTLTLINIVNHSACLRLISYKYCSLINYDLLCEYTDVTVEVYFE